MSREEFLRSFEDFHQKLGEWVSSDQHPGHIASQILPLMKLMRLELDYRQNHIGWRLDKPGRLCDELREEMVQLLAGAEEVLRYLCHDDDHSPKVSFQQLDGRAVVRLAFKQNWGDVVVLVKGKHTMDYSLRTFSGQRNGKVSSEVKVFDALIITPEKITEHLTLLRDRNKTFS